MAALDLTSSSVDLTRAICDIASESGDETTLADAIEAGELGIVGLTYSLAEGRAWLREVVGEVSDQPDTDHALPSV